ncbi:hypothetical protein CR513_08725, partial [Mucuna pruriens]
MTCDCLPTHWPRMAPSVELDVSQITSNGYSSSVPGGSVWSSWKASMQGWSKMNSTSFCSSLDNGKVILLKFLMNRLEKPACPRNEQTFHTKARLLRNYLYRTDPLAIRYGINDLGYNQAQPATRSLGRGPLGQVENQPMQANGSNQEGSGGAPRQQYRTTSTPAQAPHQYIELGTEKPKVTRGDRLEHQRTLVDLNLSIVASRGESSPSSMAIVHGDRRGGWNHRIQALQSISVASVCTQLTPSRNISVEINSAQSLPRATRPAPMIVNTLHLKFCVTTLNKESQLNALFLEKNDLGLGQMENHDRTLKELATPDVVYQPWCIQYPQLEPAQTYELKSGLIHLLPKFHGLAGEDPHKHLKEFHVVCSTMRPQGIPEDYIKMKAFPFSLDGAAKDWLYLQPTLFNTWGDMKRTFLEKFFPASRTATIRKEICGIRQHTGETLHEYWERFNKLCATCPHHQISEQLLIQYFYEGLSMMDRSMIDAASGGALMDKTPVAARHLISNMASNTQQFGIRGPNSSLVRQLAVSQHHPAMAAKVCGICTSMEHPTDLCPTLQETESGQTESVGAVGGFQYGKQPYQNRQFDNQPYGKQPFRPNPQPGPYGAQRAGYMPNAPYGAAGYQQPSPQYTAPSFPPPQQRTPTQGNSPSLEDLMKQLATSNLEFQQSVSSSNLQFQQNMTATI